MGPTVLRSGARLTTPSLRARSILAMKTCHKRPASTFFTVELIALLAADGR